MGFCYDEQIKHGKNKELNYNQKYNNIIKNNSYENMFKKFPNKNH